MLVKPRHALPVAGSLKARGGIYAVMHFAEKVALEQGLLILEQDDYSKPATEDARALFSGYDTD